PPRKPKFADLKSSLGKDFPASTGNRWGHQLGANQSLAWEEKARPSLIMQAEKRYLHETDGANHLSMRHHTSKYRKFSFARDSTVMG
ncbi:hypothetical protein CEXT_178701, partial [Caerostris extrusa]